MAFSDRASYCAVVLFSFLSSTLRLQMRHNPEAKHCAWQRYTWQLQVILLMCRDEASQCCFVGNKVCWLFLEMSFSITQKRLSCRDESCPFHQSCSLSCLSWFVWFRSRTGKHVLFCEKDTFTATCADDESVRVHSAMFGRKMTNRCASSIRQQCSSSEAEVRRILDAHCAANSSCSFRILDSQLAQIHSTCLNDYRPYLEATYSCDKGNTNFRSPLFFRESFTGIFGIFQFSNLQEITVLGPNRSY